MDYNGGPVMPSNTDYMVLWSPAGLSAYPAGYVSGLATYFKDLAHDNGGHQNADSVSAQYNDLTGAFARYQVTFGGVLVDTHPYPPTECPAAAPVTACLTDPQIQAELERLTASRGLKTDLSHEYFLLPPPGVESCFSGDPNANPAFGGCSAGEPLDLAFFCAYHSNTTLSPMLIYSNNPFDATTGTTPTASPMVRSTAGLATSTTNRSPIRWSTTHGPTAPGPTTGKNSPISARPRWVPRWGRRPTAPSTTR
jgi:hypothetical protein